MRPLDVVVPHEGLGGDFGLFQVRRPIQGEALFLIGAVVPFDKGVLLGVMRLAELDLNTQTGSKAHQSRRKITASWAAHPARIAVQGNARGAAILDQGQRQGALSPFLP